GPPPLPFATAEAEAELNVGSACGDAGVDDHGVVVDLVVPGSGRGWAVAVSEQGHPGCAAVARDIDIADGLTDVVFELRFYVNVGGAVVGEVHAVGDRLLVLCCGVGSVAV